MNKKDTSTLRHISETSMFSVWSTMRQILKNRIASWSLPFHATITLLHLHTHPEDAEPARLSECTCIPRQTMTFALDTLEKQGLATRAPHPNDRRRKIVVLSRKGKALVESIVQDLLEYEAMVLANFSVKEREVLKSLVQKFTEALQKTEIKSTERKIVNPQK